MESVIARVLRTSKTIAVVGLSPKPERPSHEVAHYLQAQGYRIVPINPGVHGKLLLGEMCFASLREAAAALAPRGIQIDLVDCFRQSEEIPAIAQDAIAIGARALWMQKGVRNDEAARQAEAAGLVVVQDLCTKIEHRRLHAND
ncbi:MAG: CoA-binding protein [Comamonas sp.]|nr:CoA-binding protein [Comamonas sp.]